MPPEERHLWISLMTFLWDSDIDLVVAGDFVYLPQLLDPSIARDLEALSPGKLAARPAQTGSDPLVIEARGSYFVRTVSLTSLVEQFASIQPEVWEGLRRALRKEAGNPDDTDPAFLDSKLAVILFQVLPYFLRRSKSFAREALDQEKILQIIRAKVRIPPHQDHRAGPFVDHGELKEAMARWDKLAASPGPPPSGFMPASRLKDWFLQALTAKIAAREKSRLAEVLKEREKWAAVCHRHADVLAYLAEKGALELDDFGFHRLRPNEYRIYKRTGVYALRDYYGRPYIFPDCRVAVNTCGRLMPYVIERYKHPLLHRHSSGQEICLSKNFKTPLSFSAAGVIQALEAGINALYYGYNPRRRNGYHSLDRVQQMRVVDFDDYRVSSDDPRIVSGEVEVKNIFY